MAGRKHLLLIAGAFLKARRLALFKNSCAIISNPRRACVRELSSRLKQKILLLQMEGSSYTSLADLPAANLMYQPT